MGKKGSAQDPMANWGWPMDMDDPYDLGPEHGVPCPFP